MIIQEKEAIMCTGGGTSLSAALISAAAKLMTALYGFGQNLGTTIRRMITKTNC